MDENQHDLLNKDLKPSVLSRRGEYTAWFSALFVIATWFFLVLRGVNAHPIFLFLGIFLLLMAIMMSIGSWVDRHTVIRVDKAQIFFQNGLRRMELSWDQIQGVQVYPSQMGKKVRVITDGMQFNFRTYAEIQSMGKVRGYMGIPKGDALLNFIIESAQLKSTQHSESVEYYVRE